MRKVTRWMLAVASMLALAGSAFAAPKQERPNDYWTQFAAGHETTLPIGQWLALTDELWTGSIGGHTVSLHWNEGEVTATADDVQLMTITGSDESGRPTYEVINLDTASTMATGFVDVDEDNAWGIVEVWEVGALPRRFAGPDLTPGEDGADELIMCTTCKCFGIGTVKNDCTNKQCDEGESCGTDDKGNNNACRWTADLGSGCDDSPGPASSQKVLSPAGSGGLSGTK